MFPTSGMWPCLSIESSHLWKNDSIFIYLSLLSVPNNIIPQIEYPLKTRCLF
jgi:hypothetical protein